MSSLTIVKCCYPKKLYATISYYVSRTVSCIPGVFGMQYWIHSYQSCRYCIYWNIGTWAVQVLVFLCMMLYFLLNPSNAISIVIKNMHGFSIINKSQTIFGLALFPYNTYAFTVYITCACAIFFYLFMFDINIDNLPPDYWSQYIQESPWLIIILL